MAMLEEKSKLTTLEEIQKAYQNLSDEDKKSFSQSISDRVDESVGEQEAASGTEDSQSAEDRVDEAEGESSEIKKEEENKEDENLSAESGEEVKEDTKDYSEEIKECLRKLSEAEYDEIFGNHQRRNLDKYVTEHKNERPMPTGQATGEASSRPKVTLL